MAQLSLRPLDWPDLPSLVSLANRELVREPESILLSLERLQSQLSAPGVHLAEDGCCVVAGGQLTAWVVLWSDASQRASGRGFLFGPFVDETAYPGAADALLEWAMVRARRIGLRQVVGNAWDFDQEKRALFRRNRFYHEAHAYLRMKLFEMGFLPMPSLPAGIDIRDANPEQDVDAMVSTINRAFAGMWDFAPETPETVRHTMAASGQNPTERALLAWHGSEPVGICWTGTRPSGGDRPGDVEGWIGVLAVVPEFRRRGLGRSLLLYGLLSLWDHGVLSASLVADADNASALQLYQSLGFTDVSTSVYYLGEVTD